MNLFMKIAEISALQAGIFLNADKQEVVINNERKKYDEVTINDVIVAGEHRYLECEDEN